MTSRPNAAAPSAEFSTADLSEALAALQAQAEIAGAMLDAELAGHSDDVAELRDHLALVHSVMTRHHELCCKIMVACMRARRSIPSLRVEELRSLLAPTGSSRS